MDIFERSKLRIDAPSVFFVDDCLEEVLEALDQLLKTYFFEKSSQSMLSVALVKT